MSQKNVELLRWVAAMANEGDIEAMDTVAETCTTPTLRHTTSSQARACPS